MNNKTFKNKQKKERIDPFELGDYNLDFSSVMEKNIQDKNNFEKDQNIKPKQEFTIFNRVEYLSDRQVKSEIVKLSETIKNEVEHLKKQTRSFSKEVLEIEKNTFQNNPEKTGIYHVRFLENLLNLVFLLKQKVSESNTWLSAINSKRKKRGSFLSLSKSKGTQYSMSQELQVTRSVQ